MKNLMSLILMTALTGCVSAKDGLSNKKVEKISFSVASTTSKSGDLTLVGSSPNCSIKWDVERGILTHRMNCPQSSKEEVWAYLLGMSSKLKVENKKPLYFVRYTTKDFPKEEKQVGKLFRTSKLWKKLSFKNIRQKKYKNFSNKFLTRVIEKKQIFSLVPKALNAVGYNFKIDKVEIQKFKAYKDGVLIPKATRVVFKKKGLK